MTQVPPSDIFARRVCLQLDGMDAVSVRTRHRLRPDGPSSITLTCTTVQTKPNER